MEILLENIASYLNALDWMYILTFILIGYIINYCKITELFTKWTKIRIRTRYRVAIVGSIYGVFIYFIRGYRFTEIEILVASFFFALVFHKLLIDAFVNRFFPQLTTGKPEKPKEQ